MKKLLLYAIALLVLISCSQDTPADEITPIQVSGSVTKGNFVFEPIYLILSRIF